jgi:hypothetical protein
MLPQRVVYQRSDEWAVAGEYIDSPLQMSRYERPKSIGKDSTSVRYALTCFILLPFPFSLNHRVDDIQAIAPELEAARW